MKEIIYGKEYNDALFIGASRTYYHVNPQVVDSVLNVKSFNAGVDGANLLEMNMILQCYLTSHPAPKYVIVELAIPAFDVKSKPFWNPNIYFPFLNNEIVFNTLKPYKKVYLLRTLPFLQFSEYDDFLRQGAIEGLMGKEKPLDPHYENGYLESGTDTISLPFKYIYPDAFWKADEIGMALLKEINETCKKRGIKLFVTYSPVYNLKDKVMIPSFLPSLKKICDSSAIPFLDYRNLSINNDHRLFRDEIHLNKYGADIYSKILATDLKRLITKETY